MGCGGAVSVIHGEARTLKRNSLFAVSYHSLEVIFTDYSKQLNGLKGCTLNFFVACVLTVRKHLYLSLISPHPVVSTNVICCP